MILGVSNKLDAPNDFIPMKYNSQGNNLRLHSAMGTDGLGTRWNYDTFNNLTDYDSSYFRLPLNAENSGEYTINFRIVGENYRVRIKINDADFIEQTWSGSWSQYTDIPLTVGLDAGTNLIIIQVRDWGVIDSYSLPNGLSYINDDTDGHYYFENQLNLCTALNGLVDSTDLGDLTVGPFKNDEDAGYTSSSTVLFKTLEDTKSLDLVYKLDGTETRGDLGIAMSVNNNSYVPLLFSEITVNTQHTYHISETTLLEAGFNFTANSTNTLKFKGLLANGESDHVFLDELHSSNVADDTGDGETHKVETEECVIYGRYVVRTGTSDAETWSGGKYVGNLGPEKAVSNASDITMDGTTLKVIEVPVQITTPGRYAIQVSYATSASASKIYYRANEETLFKQVNLASSGNWCTPCALSAKMYATLNSGWNKIYVTGTSTNGSWVNYDYFKISRVVDPDNCYISYDSSNLYNITLDNESVTTGGSTAFSFALTENASQFTGTYSVLANGTLITPNQTTGKYELNNLTEDVNISVSGLTPNVWHVYYYDGEKLVHTDEVNVGETIKYYEPPLKRGYRFDGYEENTVGNMPNSDLTFHLKFVSDASQPNMIDVLINTLSIAVPVVAFSGIALIYVFHFIKKRKLAK